MLSCKELPSDSNPPQADNLDKVSHEVTGDSRSDTTLYRWLLLSLLAHLALCSIFFIHSLLFSREERHEVRTMEAKLVTITKGREPLPHAQLQSSPIPTLSPAIQPQPQLLSQSLPNLPLPATVNKDEVSSEEALESEVIEAEEAEIVSTVEKILTVKEKSAKPVISVENKVAKVASIPKRVVTPSLPPQASPPVSVAENLPAGSNLGNITDRAEVLRTYEQAIALWFEKHKRYPSGSNNSRHEGEAMLRIRIDRQGAILFYSIERSTGNASLDEAVIAMVQQSNPVPPIPREYTGDDQVEFLLPISFTLNNKE